MNPQIGEDFDINLALAGLDENISKLKDQQLDNEESIRLLRESIDLSKGLSSNLDLLEA